MTETSWLSAATDPIECSELEVSGSRPGFLSVPFGVGALSFLHVDVLGQIYLVELGLAAAVIFDMGRRLRGDSLNNLGRRLLPRYSWILLYIILLTQIFRASGVVPSAKAILLYL